MTMKTEDKRTLAGVVRRVRLLGYDVWYTQYRSTDKQEEALLNAKEYQRLRAAYEVARRHQFFPN